MPFSTLCDKSLSVACSRSWFSLGTPISSTSKTDSHDITEMWLKMALNTLIGDETEEMTSSLSSSNEKEEFM
jgi:hypothetical protein